MHCPIDSKPNNILLEPIYKKKKNLLKRSLCVYVNNTKKVSTLEKDKKKKSLWRKRASILMMPWLLQQMTSEKSVPQPSVLVALPFKLGVSLTEINVVFSALSIYLSSGCIDWKLNNEIVKKKKKWLVKKIIQLPLISCKRKLFLFLNERSAFYFLT